MNTTLLKQLVEDDDDIEHVIAIGLRNTGRGVSYCTWQAGNVELDAAEVLKLLESIIANLRKEVV